MIGGLAPVLAAGGPVIPNFGGGGGCVREDRFFCWSWFSSHWSDKFQPALIQHVILTAIAVGIGFAIALAAALLAHRRRYLEGAFSGFADYLYTIPSLALFFLLVPLTGLTALTAEIALVSYTLAILFRNIIVGLREVPEDIRDAARGMGLTAGQILRRVELPLAMPSIVAGLRVATVTVISLTTIAAVVSDQGLGAPIFEAIQSPFNTQFVAAGALAILLALVADALLVGLQRVLTPWNAAARA